ncbi:hypothetical protein CfE428DRAFT_0109 [Chthoniobacter flavus Ellin428]|uniref:Uncharacterized protein n=1 Tax=Chthoniobacter flavus Ellin428 TaxID=497964 RepID=B4CTU6_9BACT|nr:hypothetical protein [Chthoniobacter flavus]EDY21984.1 hypothetical protein CfE428DRAFT_0109 [Chthoniobacter flavus Ellin428]TCO89371.1 hypothetical protein EV701_114105 [Chthoniobacter flavus]
MNEFERKLSQQIFRPPPADLRATLFGASPLAAASAPPALWTWRDWFWPSPQAWGALAALWVVFVVQQWDHRPPRSPEGAALRGLSAVVQWSNSELTSPESTPSAELRAEDTTLLAFHSSQELHHALDSLH